MPAGQPSVRSTRSAASESLSSTPATACTNEAACAGVNPSSLARISVRSPLARSRASRRGERVDQQREQGAQHVLRPLPQAGAVEFRNCLLQRPDNMPPQPGRVVVAPVQGDPGEPPLRYRTCTPLRYQRGLAETRRGIDQDQLGGAVRELGDEVLPLHPFLTQA